MSGDLQDEEPSKDVMFCLYQQNSVFQILHFLISVDFMCRVNIIVGTFLEVIAAFYSHLWASVETTTESSPN